MKISLEITSHDFRAKNQNFHVAKLNRSSNWLPMVGNMPMFNCAVVNEIDEFL